MKSTLHSLFILALLISAASRANPPQTVELFQLVQTKTTGKIHPLFQAIELNDQLRNMTTGQSLSITLNDGLTRNLSISRTQQLANGDQLLAAANDGGEKLLLTLGKRAAFGNIEGNGIRYHIGFRPDSGPFLVDQSDPRIPSVDLGDDLRIPPNAGPRKLLKASTIEKTNNTDIRLLVLYSEEFDTAFGSARTRINQMVAFTNQAFTRSNIAITLVLANAVQGNFDNDSSNNQLLDQVTDGVGPFTSVPQMRDSLGADLVAVVRFLPVNFGSGLAWLNGDQAEFAFSVSQFSHVGFDSVFAHEIGHNLGSGHERTSVNPNAGSPCGANFTGYSCGHGNRSAGWGTIMSRLNSAAVNHVYSNPNLSCQGSPCGIPQGQSNAADNSTSFNISKLLVANFRDDPSVVAPVVVPLLLED